MKKIARKGQLTITHNPPGVVLRGTLIDTRTRDTLAQPGDPHYGAQLGTPTLTPEGYINRYNNGGVCDEDTEPKRSSHS